MTNLFSTQKKLTRALLPLLLILHAAAAAAETMQSRLWATSENLRVVLESAQPLDYSVSGFQSPARLELDVHVKAGDNIGLEQNESLQSATAYVANIRASRVDSKIFKVVFDLSAGIKYEVNRLQPIGKYQHRLVIDIAPQEPPEDPLFAFIQQLQQSKSGDDAPPFLVLLDPGHGGEDPGAVSPNNNYEKNIVLQISHKIRDEINRRPNMRAVLSRENDKFIPLYNRVHLSHRLKVNAFLSIHADSVKNRKARGSSVFVLSEKGASSKFARRMATQANLSDLVGGAPSHSKDKIIDTALRQFSHDGKDRASRQLAQFLIDNISNINTMHSKRVESAGFAVLKSPSIPSVLVETAFISNAEEEKKLLNKDFQFKMAMAIADAVQRYRDTYHVQ